MTSARNLDRIPCVYAPKCEYMIPIFDQTTAIMELHIREVHRNKEHEHKQTSSTDGWNRCEILQMVDGVTKTVLKFSKKKFEGTSGKTFEKYRCEDCRQDQEY